MDLEEIWSNLEDSNTDEDQLKYLVNEIADDIETNPELSKDILNLFDKIMNHPNFNRKVEIKAEKLLTNMLNMNPELSTDISDQNTNCSITGGEILQNIVRDNWNLDLEIKEKILKIDESLANDKSTIKLIALMYRQLDEKNLPPMSERQKELMTYAKPMRFSRPEEIDYAVTKYPLERLSKIDFSIINKNSALILKEAVREKQDINQTQDPKKFMQEFYKNNTYWITAGSFKAKKLFGRDLNAYLRKTQKYLSIHDSLIFLPDDMDLQKNASFYKFINKHLIYATDDGQNQVRPLKELKIISENWRDLTPEQEKGSYKDILESIYLHHYDINNYENHNNYRRDEDETEDFHDDFYDNHYGYNDIDVPTKNKSDNKKKDKSSDKTVYLKISKQLDR